MKNSLLMVFHHQDPITTVLVITNESIIRISELRIMIKIDQNTRNVVKLEPYFLPFFLRTSFVPAG